MGCSREPHPGREDAETGPAGTGAVVQHGRPRSLTGDRRRRMLYRAIAFSLGGASAAGPGAGVCADAEATGPFIDLTRGVAHDEPVRGGMTMEMMPLLMGSLVAGGCGAGAAVAAPY